MGGNPTIRDVASAAGVSVRTVSRVLNDNPSVSKETQRKVYDAIRKLNYQPNPLARVVGGANSRTVGVVIGHEPRVAFSNPLHFEVVGGIAHTASQLGYTVMLLSGAVNVRYVDLLKSKQLGGLIFMSVPGNDRQVYEVLDEGFPVILTCPYEAHERACYVDVDNELGAHKAVQHLLSCGHTNIALINGPMHYGSSQARLNGYRSALEEHGIPFNPRWVLNGDFTEESGHGLAGFLLSSGYNITAIFATSDLMAIGAVKAATQRGYRIPDDIAVVGFDDISLARYIDPPLTTVRQPAFEKGATAMQLLAEFMNGGQSRERKILLTPELVIRNSTTPIRSVYNKTHCLV